MIQQTSARYPGQQFPKETLQAWLDDWLVVVSEVGYDRFREGLQRAWTYSQFFPHLAQIRDLIPAPRLKDWDRQKLELSDLRRRKASGEKFYTISDVFHAVAHKIRAGEIKPSNPSWFEWAKSLNPK